MKFSGLQWKMIRVSGKLLAIYCLLTPAAIAQSTGNSLLPPPPPATNVAGNQSIPVGQVLIPEGVYARGLIDSLNLGPITDEAKAEALLSSLGIEPKYGWISEYPVTPEILGEIDNDIVKACEQGKIAIPREQAASLVSELKTRLGFNISHGPISPPAAPPQPPVPSKIYKYIDIQGGEHFTDSYESIPPEYRNQAQIISQYTPTPGAAPGASAYPMPYPSQYAPTLDPNLLNGYYQDQGPPVVTYYQPPQDYSYLYSWVPYSFWAAGNYFPGFFIMNNFHRQLMFNNQPYAVSHHAGPLNNRSFGNQGINGMPNGMNQGMNHNWYTSPGALNGATAIINQGQNRSFNNNTAQPQNLPQQRMPQPERIIPPGQYYQPPLNGRGLNQQPNQNQPLYQPERINQPPVYQQPQHYNQPPLYQQPQHYQQPPVYQEPQRFNPPPVYQEQPHFNPPPAFHGGESGGGFRGHEGVEGGANGGGFKGGGGGRR